LFVQFRENRTSTEKRFSLFNHARYDYLGSVWMVTSGPTGTVVSRHDFLPFGEEVTTAVRPSGLGFTGSDYVSQRFTAKVRDAESGLDYFGARYYGSALGRFTSPDPENISGLGHMDDPQSWNGYSYVRNNPLRFTDPNGLDWTVCESNGSNCGTVTDDKAFEKYAKDQGWTIKGGNIYDNGGNQIGTASWSQAGGDAFSMLNRAGNMAAPGVNLAGAGTVAVMGGAFAGMAYGAIVGGEGIAALGLEVLPSQARNIETIDTIIADHVTTSDLMGGAKESAGMEIRSSTGKLYDHIQELGDARRGLAKAVSRLENSLNDPSHGAAARSVVQQAIQKGQAAIRMIDAALRR
jgi:RHS repeat-associated protein